MKTGVVQFKGMTSKTTVSLSTHPSKQASKTVKLVAKEEVRIVEELESENEKWCKVQNSDSVSGWVLAKYILST